MWIYSPKTKTGYTPEDVIYDPAAIDGHWDEIRRRHGWEDTDDFDLADHIQEITLADWSDLLDDPHPVVLTVDLEAAIGDAEKSEREAQRQLFIRDQTIRAALDQGLSLRDVAAVAGLSHTAVANIRDRTPESYDY